MRNFVHLKDNTPRHKQNNVACANHATRNALSICSTNLCSDTGDPASQVTTVHVSYLKNKGHSFEDSTVHILGIE